MTGIEPVPGIGVPNPASETGVLTVTLHPLNFLELYIQLDKYLLNSVLL